MPDLLLPPPYPPLNPAAGAGAAYRRHSLPLLSLLPTAFHRHSLPFLPLLPVATAAAHANRRDGGGDGQGAGGMRRAERRRAKERLGRSPVLWRSSLALPRHPYGANANAGRWRLRWRVAGGGSAGVRHSVRRARRAESRDEAGDDDAMGRQRGAARAAEKKRKVRISRQ
ncbi:unnamed protein product [Closterium sp. NIES-64]|nr:unnamed protein product [Closterium sp. NIES-64]